MAMSKLLVGSRVVQGKISIWSSASLLREGSFLDQTQGRDGVVVENFRGCGGGDGDEGWPGKVVQG
jgi:hypothetical protein